MGLASLWFTNVLLTTAESAAAGALTPAVWPAPGGANKKTAIRAIATIAAAAKPNRRPSEYRDIPVRLLAFEGFTDRIRRGGVCCSSLSGGIPEVSPTKSVGVSRPGCDFKMFAPASSGEIANA
jgi:hypothetical protein